MPAEAYPNIKREMIIASNTAISSARRMIAMTDDRYTMCGVPSHDFLILGRKHHPALPTENQIQNPTVDQRSEGKRHKPQAG